MIKKCVLNLDLEFGSIWECLGKGYQLDDVVGNR